MSCSWKLDFYWGRKISHNFEIYYWGNRTFFVEKTNWTQMILMIFRWNKRFLAYKDVKLPHRCQRRCGERGLTSHSEVTRKRLSVIRERFRKSGQSLLTNCIPAMQQLARMHCSSQPELGTHLTQHDDRAATSSRGNSSLLTPILLVRRNILMTDGVTYPPSLPTLSFYPGQHGKG